MPTPGRLPGVLVVSSRISSRIMALIVIACGGLNAAGDEADAVASGDEGRNHLGVHSAPAVLLVDIDVPRRLGVERGHSNGCHRSTSNAAKTARLRPVA
jgi:hypothetical protein